jgi:hypothetical protein
MPLMDETARKPKDILDCILKAQQQMKLAGMLQGSGGISVSIGKSDEGNTDDDLVLRIQADAPLIKQTSRCRPTPCFDHRTPAREQISPANEAGPNGGWDACRAGYFFFL